MRIPAPQQIYKHSDSIAHRKATPTASKLTYNIIHNIAKYKGYIFKLDTSESAHQTDHQLSDINHQNDNFN